MASSVTSVQGVFESLEDVLPLDDQAWRDVLVLEQRGDRVPDDPVPFVLARLDARDVSLDAPQVAQVAESSGQMLGRTDQEPALLDRLLHRRFDAVETEKVGCPLGVI